MRLSRTVNLDDEELEEVVDEFAGRCGATPRRSSKRSVTMHTGIEMALRRSPDTSREPKQPDIRAEAHRQGPAIAACFTTDEQGVWYHPRCYPSRNRVSPFGFVPH